MSLQILNHNEGENIGDSLRDGKAERDINPLTVAKIAQKYTSIFKLAKYSAIGINIRSYSPQASIQSATTLSSDDPVPKNNGNTGEIEIPFAPDLYPKTLL